MYDAPPPARPARPVWQQWLLHRGWQPPYNWIVLIAMIPLIVLFARYFPVSLGVAFGIGVILGGIGNVLPRHWEHAILTTRILSLLTEVVFLVLAVMLYGHYTIAITLFLSELYVVWYWYQNEYRPMSTE